MPDQYPDDRDLYEYTTDVGGHVAGDRVSLTPPEAEERGDILRQVGDQELEEIQREAEAPSRYDTDRQTHFVEYQHSYGSHVSGDRTWVTPEQYQELQEAGAVVKVRVDTSNTDERDELREEVRRANLSELSYNTLYATASDVADALDDELSGRSQEVCMEYLVEHYRDLKRLVDEGDIDIELDS
jgi:hypothetical protein